MANATIPGNNLKNDASMKPHRYTATNRVVVLERLTHAPGPYLVACGKYTRCDEATFKKAVKKAWAHVQSRASDHCAIFAKSDGKKCAEVYTIDAALSARLATSGRILELHA